MSYTLSNARASDHDELLAYLLDAFKTNDPNHPAFDALYPDLFHATDSAMTRHRIIREDGKIRACVGWYPMRVAMGEITVDVFGIGQVSCAPSLRGGGRMTNLLEDVCARMDKSGAALSWLGGRRDRYAHFGWESAGSNFHSWLDSRSVGEPPAGWTVKQIDPAATPAAWSIRERAAVREKITRPLWLERMMRGGKPHRVFLAWRGDRKTPDAMCVAQAEGSNDLLEWAGDNDGIRAILAHILKTQNHISVTYAPKSADPAAELFWNSASGNSASLSSLRILDLDVLLKSYEPWILKRKPASAAVKLAITSGAPVISNTALALDRLTMTRLLFGPLPPSHVIDLPPRLRWLDQVFPLPFILPPSSHV